jgi:hypothetical protein
LSVIITTGYIYCAKRKNNGDHQTMMGIGIERAYHPESGFGIGGAGTDAYHFTCVAKGLDATPCTIDRCNAASVAYSRQHTAHSTQQAYESCGTARARALTAQNHCWSPRIAGKCTSFNTTPPLRASGNLLGMGQWRRYALVALENAQGTQKNGEQACMQ